VTERRDGLRARPAHAAELMIVRHDAEPAAKLAATEVWVRAPAVGVG
jgi:hypothetical protein